VPPKFAALKWYTHHEVGAVDLVVAMVIPCVPPLPRVSPSYTNRSRLGT
jgi:hypothetical protein